MAEKEITNVVKLQIEAGKATPAPPVGPALGSTGINIMQFTKEFNEKTANQPGMIIPVVITVYQDKSFTFITKVPPVAVLIKKVCKNSFLSSKVCKKSNFQKTNQTSFTFQNNRRNLTNGHFSIFHIKDIKDFI